MSWVIVVFLLCLCCGITIVAYCDFLRLFMYLLQWCLCGGFMVVVLLWFLVYIVVVPCVVVSCWGAWWFPAVALQLCVSCCIVLSRCYCSCVVLLCFSGLPVYIVVVVFVVVVLLWLLVVMLCCGVLVVFVFPFCGFLVLWCIVFPVWLWSLG